MSQKLKIAAALKTKIVTEIEIYWDRQDSNNAGPAFREATGPIDQRDSGPLEFCGWGHTSGRPVVESEVIVYHIADYFSENCAYRGPDDFGIYPILAP